MAAEPVNNTVCMLYVLGGFFPTRLYVSATSMCTCCSHRIYWYRLRTTQDQSGQEFSGYSHGYWHVLADEVEGDAGLDVVAIHQVPHRTKHSVQHSHNDHGGVDDRLGMMWVLHLVLQGQHLLADGTCFKIQMMVMGSGFKEIHDVGTTNRKVHFSHIVQIPPQSQQIFASSLPLPKATSHDPRSQFKPYLNNERNTGVNFPTHSQLETKTHHPNAFKGIHNSSKEESNCLNIPKAVKPLVWVIHSSLFSDIISNAEEIHNLAHGQPRFLATQLTWMLPLHKG